MPLAFDLTSTLESGWILPVATTTRAKSPRSTEASFDGSIVRFGLSAALTPYPPPKSANNATLAQMILRRRFLPFFPFAKPLPLLDIQGPPLLRARCYTSVRTTDTNVPFLLTHTTPGRFFGREKTGGSYPNSL